MNTTIKKLLIMIAALFLFACGGAQVQGEEVLVIKKEKRVRQPVDMVGYTHNKEGIEKVVGHAGGLEKDGLEEVRKRLGFGEESSFEAAISPHDDYLYAQRAYVHVYPYIKAKHVVIIGVAHKARDFREVEDKLVFDDFDAWHGPYGDVPVSSLRESLLRELSDDDALLCDELQSVEHSVEGMVPFLQHYNREVEIVPILVPYMSWERLAQLAKKTADALGKVMESKGLTLGEDVAILVSSDSVHYGDQGWGGKNFDDFGVDQKGYDLAVERDLSLVDEHLVGEVSLNKLDGFYHKLVQEDHHEYRITWCGRFSIPFGLALLIDLKEQLNQGAPKGHLLRYATTLDPGPSDPGVPGLSFTAPAGLHHWVGFVAIGYN